MWDWVRHLFRRNNEVVSLKCPRCGGETWYNGPRGGMSQNIMCLTCEHWYNYHQGRAPLDDLHMVGRDRRPADDK